MATMTKTSFWNTFVIPLTNRLLTKNLIINSFPLFKKEILNKMVGIQFIAVQVIIEYKGHQFKTLGKICKVNTKDLDKLLEVILEYLDFKAEEYFTTESINLIYKYRLITTDNLLGDQNIIHKPKSTEAFTTSMFGYDLPNNIDILTWGKVVEHSDNNIIIEFIKNDKKYYYLVEKFKNFNLVQIKSHPDDDNILLEFRDNSHNGSLTSFTRQINTQEYVFRNSQIIVKYETKRSKFITKLNKDKCLDERYLTLDIETKTLNKVVTPYCVGIFDGKIKKSFYLTDFNGNIELMLITAIKSLMIPKYHAHKVYIHNLSNFDGIFLLRILALIVKNKEDLKIIKKDNNIINIKLYFDGYFIEFRDSYLILLASLRKFAKSFKVEDKGIFPYNFVNENNVPLDYIGKFPDFKYFSNISLLDYTNYICNFVHKDWNLKDETIKYCIQDCVTLYLIIQKFNLLIFKKFKININKHPTLPSLAFAIFRSKYLGNSKIPIIVGNIFNDIRKSYTGGAVDMYIPYGENIYGYDVNSLYPTVMANKPLPVGTPKYFEGNILDLKSKPFGFFEVEITAPDNLNIPILQTKVKTVGGKRTIAPLGTWTDIMFSEEIYNAMTFGYKFKIKRGWLFNKSTIFNKYTQDLYLIKSTHHKDDPMYYIAKLLMNSLYGRFGMNIHLEEHKILNHKDLEKLIQIDHLECSSIDLGDDLNLCSILDNNKYDKIDITNNHNLNVSIPIAAAITAYARIYMSQFKKGDYTIYYSDTDSIFIDKPLPDHLVGNELGQFKLEYVASRALFLAPKVYALEIIENGKTKEIIKIKGLKKVVSNEITFDKLKELLEKDKSLLLNQTKSFRNFEKGNINLLEQIYTLVATENKRQFIFKDNILTNTKPYIIDNSKTINKKYK